MLWTFPRFCYSFKAQPIWQEPRQIIMAKPSTTEHFPLLSRWLVALWTFLPSGSRWERLPPPLSPTPSPRLPASPLTSMVLQWWSVALSWIFTLQLIKKNLKHSWLPTSWSVLKKRSKTHKRLKERFLIRRNRTKCAKFRGKPLFQLFSVVLLYVAWKRGFPRKFARFVLFCLIKKQSFNLLCVLDLTVD